MSLKRDENGVWTVEIDKTDQVAADHSHPSYFEALPRYLTVLDPAFIRASEVSEFNFLSSIFAPGPAGRWLGSLRNDAKGYCRY